MTDPELAIEPAIAALGEPYRCQWLFVGIHHIADFVIPGRKLVIEVDGASHNDPKQRFKDLKHTIWLTERGWKVVRCTNEEALNSPYVTLSELLHYRVHHLPTLEQLKADLAKCPVPPKKPRKPKTNSETTGSRKSGSKRRSS